MNQVHPPNSIKTNAFNNKQCAIGTPKHHQTSLHVLGTAMVLPSLVASSRRRLSLRFEAAKKRVVYPFYSLYVSAMK